MKKNNKLAEAQQKFQSFYKANLQQIYNQLEKTRHKYFSSFKNRLAGFALLTGVCYYLYINNLIPLQLYESDLFTIAVIILLIVIGALIYQPFIDYREKTKDKTMKKILSFWGNFDYFLEQDIIGDNVIKKSELFTYFNRTESDDAFSGMYGDTKIKVSEHNLKIHGSKGDTHIFRGVLILLDFSKKFSGKTIVKNKNRALTFLRNNPLWALIPITLTFPFFTIGINLKDTPFVSHLAFVFIPLISYFIILYILYRLYCKFSKKKATQNVALEKINFARNWSVLTDDQIEARYILNPAFMEKIAEIKQLFYGSSVDFSFFENKLLIAVHTRKNLFETTSLFLPALSYYKVREVVSQLHSIFSVIDILKDRLK